MNLSQRALLSFGLLAVFLPSCAREGTGIPITTTHATRQSLTSWISSNGKVEPIEPHVIQSQLTTFIQTVSVKQGDKVKRGQVLMTLDAKDLESELSRVKGELVTAEDEHRIASAGGSPDELAQLQSDLAKTETEIARLRREAESLDRLYAKQAATRQHAADAAARQAAAREYAARQSALQQYEIARAAAQEVLAQQQPAPAPATPPGPPSTVDR